MIVNLFTEQKADNNHMHFLGWKAPGAVWQGESLVSCKTTQPWRGSAYESFYVPIYVAAVQPSAITWLCTPGFPKHLCIGQQSKISIFGTCNKLTIFPAHSPLQQGNRSEMSTAGPLRGTGALRGTNKRTHWWGEHKPGMWQTEKAKD